MGFPNTPLLDDFNRSTIGGNWSAGRLDANGLPNPTSNQLQADGVNFRDGTFTPVSVHYPIEVFVTVVAQRAGFPANETCLLYAMDASGNGYGLIVRGNTYQFERIDTASTQTQLGTAQNWGTSPFTNGDKLGARFDSDGTTVTMTAFQNGVAQSVQTTDSGGSSHPSLATFYNPGMEIGADATIIVDNFGGGGVSVGGAAAHPLMTRLIPIWSILPGFAAMPGGAAPVVTPDNPHPVISPRTTIF